MLNQTVSIQKLEETADTYFKNLSPQQSNGWEYTGFSYYDAEKDVIVGEYIYEWGGDRLPRMMYVSPETIMEAV